MGSGVCNRFRSSTHSWTPINRCRYRDGGGNSFATPGPIAPLPQGAEGRNLHLQQFYQRPRRIQLVEFPTRPENSFGTLAPVTWLDERAEFDFDFGIGHGVARVAARELNLAFQAAAVVHRNHDAIRD